MVFFLDKFLIKEDKEKLYNKIKDYIDVTELIDKINMVFNEINEKIEERQET